jgi:hypothetical protein
MIFSRIENWYVNDASTVLAKFLTLQLPGHTNGTSVQQKNNYSFGQKAAKTSNHTNKLAITAKLSTEMKSTYHL